MWSAHKTEAFHYSYTLLNSESHVGNRPIAADELSDANFSVRARQYEDRDFICSQNMPYPFESSVNTAGTPDWWQLANK